MMFKVKCLLCGFGDWVLDLGSWQVDKTGEGLTDAATFFMTSFATDPFSFSLKFRNLQVTYFNSRSSLQRPNPVKELHFL